MFLQEQAGKQCGNPENFEIIGNAYSESQKTGLTATASLINLKEYQGLNNDVYTMFQPIYKLCDLSLTPDLTELPTQTTVNTINSLGGVCSIELDMKKLAVCLIDRNMVRKTQNQKNNSSKTRKIYNSRVLEPAFQLNEFKLECPVSVCQNAVCPVLHAKPSIYVKSVKQYVNFGLIRLGTQIGMMASAIRKSTKRGKAGDYRSGN